ncbi:sulfurtransferase complex subunit TusC [Psychromonas sp. 14N.309.X.WAT.B.A12]|uniref:sulfurtransferase complex subunit TusC n=1 Tax=unclassified Psychromonas TaxID=2614957 RepID=UPI0025B1760D|nr:sulfurtransferase complex subunit TusC [Psychromonas sp. 14N.309.X.WAT.B.A12]MDN2664373.1 sulfurtransferase complex subunit TusC [Psychromonas sp. 14N.309.X.WAT.B.A12]
MEKKIGIVNRQAPHGRSDAREALDLTLALSAYNESLSVFFIGDGVYQLLKKHQADSILQKDFQPMLKMFDLYDIEQVYVCASSLALRNISVEQLVIKTELLSTDEIKQHLAEQDQLMSF